MKIAFHLFLFIAFLFGATQSTYSCSCLQRSNEEEIKTTDFIFVGKVVEITQDKTFVPSKDEEASEELQKAADTIKRYFIKFKIKNKFKGTDSDEITLVKYELENFSCSGLIFTERKT